MNLVALLRGINVGKTKRIDMKSLKCIFEELGYSEVSTYINSGNVRFDSNQDPFLVVGNLERILKVRTGETIRVLVKTKKQMIEIGKSIPTEWQNDEGQKTDVAYLFHDADKKEIVDDLPVRREYLEIIYVDGALIWNVKRKD